VIEYPTYHGWSGVPDSGPRPLVPRMPRRRRRALRRIERDLVASDPRLARLSCFFTQLTANERMPAAEKIGRWPARVLVRFVGRARKARRHAPTPDGGCRGKRLGTE
jgi:hypothetical protein